MAPSSPHPPLRRPWKPTNAVSLVGRHAPRTHALDCDPGEEDGGLEGGARRVVADLSTEKGLPAEVGYVSLKHFSPPRSVWSPVCCIMF